jgi:hypothetical protein
MGYSGAWRKLIHRKKLEIKYLMPDSLQVNLHAQLGVNNT